MKIPLLTLAVVSLTVLRAGAESASTVPAGYFTLDIAPGQGATRTLTVLSAPLLEAAAASGQMSGRISGVTANTISCASAGWTAGQLSTPATPHLIRITSGAATGRTFLLSTTVANTSSTVTLDPEEAAQTNLTTLGIAVGAAGDTFELYQADTLSSLFGSPSTTGILGNANSSLADIVQIYVGAAWRQYYHDGLNWKRIGPNLISNNVVIRPDTAVTYSRLGSTPLSLVVLGSVPNTNRKALIANSNLTHLANGWPVNLTLATSGIHLTPGWVSSSNSAMADLVQILVNGAALQFYHDGTNWRRVGPGTISDSQVLSAGSGVTISKRGATAGSATYSKTQPYSL